MGSCERHGRHRSKCSLCNDSVPLVPDIVSLNKARDSRGARIVRIENRTTRFLASCLRCSPDEDHAAQVSAMRMQKETVEWFEKFEMWGGDNPHTTTVHLTNVLRSVHEVMHHPGCGDDSAFERKHTPITRCVVRMFLRIRERAIGQRWATQNPIGWDKLMRILESTIPLDGYTSMLHDCRFNGTTWPHQDKIPGGYSDSMDIDESMHFYRSNADIQLPPCLHREEDLIPTSTHANKKNTGLEALLRVYDHLTMTFLNYRDYMNQFEKDRHTQTSLVNEQLQEFRDHWTTQLAASKGFLLATSACKIARSRAKMFVDAHVWFIMHNKQNLLHMQELCSDENLYLRSVVMGNPERGQADRRRSFLRFVELYTNKSVHELSRIPDLCIEERKLLYEEAKAKEVVVTPSKSSAKKGKKRKQQDEESGLGEKKLCTYEDIFKWLGQNGHLMQEGSSGGGGT